MLFFKTKIVFLTISLFDKPLSVTSNGFLMFNVLQASVRAYQRNLNTHKSYREFRFMRAQLRDAGKPLDSIMLSEYLNEYAETGEKYVKILQQIIKQNQLKDFDNAKLLPSSLELESLI